MFHRYGAALLLLRLPLNIYRPPQLPQLDVARVSREPEGDGQGSSETEWWWDLAFVGDSGRGKQELHYCSTYGISE